MIGVAHECTRKVQQVQPAITIICLCGNLRTNRVSSCLTDLKEITHRGKFSKPRASFLEVEPLLVPRFSLQVVAESSGDGLVPLTERVKREDVRAAHT